MSKLLVTGDTRETRDHAGRFIKGVTPWNRKVTPKIEAQMKVDYLSGICIQHIANEVGISWGTVQRHLVNEYRERKKLAYKIEQQRRFENMVEKTRKELSDWEKGWLSGLIDGEGTLYIRKVRSRNQIGKVYEYYVTRFQIANTSKELLQKVRETIGVGCISLKAYADKRKNRKPVFCLYTAAYATKWLLPQLTLVVKARQKNLLLEFFQVKDKLSRSTDNLPLVKRLDDIVAEMKTLNQRGLK